MKQRMIIFVSILIYITPCRIYSQSLENSFMNKMIRIDSTIIFDSIRLDSMTFATTYISSRIGDSMPHVTWGTLDSNVVIGVSQKLFSKGGQILDLELLAYHKKLDMFIVFQNNCSDGLLQRKSFVLLETIRTPTQIFVFDSALNLCASYFFMKIMPWETVIIYRYKNVGGEYFVSTERTNQFADFIINRPKYYQTSHFVNLVNMVVNLSTIKPETAFHKVKYSMLIQRMIDKEFHQYIMQQYETVEH